MSILTAILMVCSFTVKGQPNNCSTRERIVLNERPSMISERDAYDMMVGVKNEVYVTYPDENRYTQAIQFPFCKLNVFEKKGVVSLKYVPGKTLPEWKVKNYYVATNSTLSTDHWGWLILGFLLSFFFGLLVINLASNWNLEWGEDDYDFKNRKEMVMKRIKILLLGLGISIIIGSVTYLFGRVKGNDSFMIGHSYKYIWKEHALHVTGVYLGGLLWITGIHIKLFFQNLFTRKKAVLQ